MDDAIWQTNVLTNNQILRGHFAAARIGKKWSNCGCVGEGYDHPLDIIASINNGEGFFPISVTCQVGVCWPFLLPLWVILLLLLTCTTCQGINKSFHQPLWAITVISWTSLLISSSPDQGFIQDIWLGRRGRGVNVIPRTEELLGRGGIMYSWSSMYIL